MTYLDITKYFGTKLADTYFQDFLKSISCDPTNYNLAKDEYITSQDKSIEIGFHNSDAQCDDDEQKVLKEGTPLFAFFNLYPKSKTYVSSMPFNINFSDTRKNVSDKAGKPIKTVDFEDKLFKKRFMIDHFRLDNLAISINYNSRDEKIEFIQIRDDTQI